MSGFENYIFNKILFYKQKRSIKFKDNFVSYFPAAENTQLGQVKERLGLYLI